MGEREGRKRRQHGENSRFGWFDLVDLELELVPGRRGRRGSTRHLRCVKASNHGCQSGQHTILAEDMMPADRQRRDTQSYPWLEQCVALQMTAMGEGQNAG